MRARVSPWITLLSAAALGLGTAGYAADTTQVEVSGTLTKPSCSVGFAASQTIEIPKVNLNSLKSDITDWTDVALDFQCVKGSQVLLRFNAGNGAFDSSTLRTSLDKLGLKTRLTDLTSASKVLDMKLGEQLTFPVADTQLNLQLSVRPVKAGAELPAIGSYSSMLLMEVIYL